VNSFSWIKLTPIAPDPASCLTATLAPHSGHILPSLILQYLQDVEGVIAVTLAVLPPQAYWRWFSSPQQFLGRGQEGFPEAQGNMKN